MRIIGWQRFRDYTLKSPDIWSPVSSYFTCCLSCYCFPDYAVVVVVFTGVVDISVAVENYGGIGRHTRSCIAA